MRNVFETPRRRLPEMMVSTPLRAFPREALVPSAEQCDETGNCVGAVIPMLWLQMLRFPRRLFLIAVQTLCRVKPITPVSVVVHPGKDAAHV